MKPLQHGASASKRLALSLAALAALTVPAVAGTIFSVDFQPNAPFGGRAPVNFSGAEGEAATAYAAFAGSNVWNHLGIAPGGGTTNPSYSNLVDSTGTVTSFGISFTGVVGSGDDVPINNTGSNGLQNDYFYLGGTNTIGYQLSGLPANTQVALYLYAPNFVLYDSGFPLNQPSRGYNLTANGTSINVASGPNGNALAFVTTDASGDISGVWSSPLGNEGDWSGFQVAVPSPATGAPEPSSWALVVGGMFVCVGTARRRRHR